jgi:DnaJ family protein A protein 2
MFFGGGRGGGQRQKQKCKARRIELKITLEQAYVGGKKTVEFSRRILCNTCKGSGSANPNAQTKCTGCQGKGMKIVMQRMGPMLLQQQQTCDDCKGTGQVIKDKCKECKAEKVVYVNKKLEIDVDKGVPDGHRYTFADEGDQYPDVETGDVFVEVFIEKHKDFIRKGADLLYKKEITLLQALTGFSMVITHLDGRKIEVKPKEGETIKPGLKTVKELGMPFHNAPYRFGNLYVEFEVVFPGKLDNSEIEKLKEIFKQDIVHKNIPEDTETYFVTDYKPEDENTHHGGGKKGVRRNEEDEDDEEGAGQQGHRVQCAHQ